jgi:hypothetical protein
MKIDHLTKTNPDHPKDSILRIFDFDVSEACQFRELLLSLADGSATMIDLNSISFVEGVDGCHLFLKVGTGSKGVIVLLKNTFECILTRDDWDVAKDLVEPFCEGNLSGYQWLCNLGTRIELLFSPNGDW